MYLSRIVLLHVMLGGLILAGSFFGITQAFWNADHMFSIPIIGSLIAVGVACAAVGRADDARWLANDIPGIGLIFTVGGLLGAATGDIGSDAFKLDIIHALVANMTGVAGMLWIRFNLRVLGHDA